MPSLRERADDIPLLVDHLVERYAMKAGKKVSSIREGTIELLQAYEWPGNVREPQNILERAVILCAGETLSVSETWLQRTTPRLSGLTAPLTATLADREREVIEAALADSQGRISGPSGAAAKLGIPRQTLDSKIANLQISKTRFKVQPVS
jgi:formate hydrogenlyase transcriptional activator